MLGPSTHSYEVSLSWHRTLHAEVAASVRLRMPQEPEFTHTRAGSKCPWDPLPRLAHLCLGVQ